MTSRAGTIRFAVVPVAVEVEVEVEDGLKRKG
jgi:hypothetical protein